MAVYEVVLMGKLRGNDALTVLHYDVSGSPDFQHMSDVIAAGIETYLQDRLVPNMVYSGIRVREDIPGGVSTVYPFGIGSLAGQDPDPEFWAQIAALVRKNTSSGSRPSQGRIYQAGLAGGATTANGIIDTSVTADLQAFWENMIQLSFDTGATAQMVIKASNPTAPNTVAYNPVTSVTALGNPATQRRRRQGSGS